MKDFVQRYWINALGLFFFFVALLYFLKLDVRIVSAVKAFFFGLGASSSVQHIIFLTVLGGLTLIIGKISAKNRVRIPAEITE